MKLTHSTLLIALLVVSVNGRHFHVSERATDEMDLKIVGAGRLGVRLALLWQAKFPDAKIYLKTHSDKPQRTAAWIAAGFIPVSSATEDKSVADFTVFCAPAHSNPNYAKDVEHAVTREWSGKGQFVFTGSGRIYTANNGSVINEDSEVIGRDETSRLLLASEQVTRNNGGIVIRFGAMITRDSGPHDVYLNSGMDTFSSSPKGFFNQQHYDDAAGAVMSALLAKKAPAEGSTYLASDGSPVSRIELCNEAKECPDYKDAKIPTFTGEGVDGKQYDTGKIRRELGWTPKFPFAKFMKYLFDQEMQCKDLYC